MASLLWQHRRLLLQFTRRSVEMQTRGSALGAAWTVLNPLILLALYVTVLGGIFGGRFGESPDETVWEYAIGVFLGLTLQQFLGETVASAPGVVAGQPNFVKKVVFPLEILPAAAVLASGVKLAVSLVLALGCAAVVTGSLAPTVLWLPIVVLPVVLLALGAGWLLSSLGVFLQDLGQFSGFAGLLLLWASAVFFSPSHVPPALYDVLRWNPLLHAVELLRGAALWGRSPAESPLALAYLYACGLALFVVGGLAFRKLRPAFADVL